MEKGRGNINTVLLDKKVIYFMSVVEEGSFSAAARKFYLSQSAISQQIKLLENELGTSLFERCGYKPVLTDVGKILYEKCLDISSDCNQIANVIKNGEKREMKIGITGFLQNKQIIEVINQYKNQNSDVDIRFVRGTFEEGVQRLLDNEVDFSLGLEAVFQRANGIEYNSLWKYKVYFICSKNHPYADREYVDVSEIADEDFVIFSKKYSKDFNKIFLENLKLEGISYKVKNQADSIDELNFLLSIGEGITIGSKDLIGDEELKVVELRGKHFSCNYAIAYKTDTLMIPEKRQFLNDIISYSEKHKFYL